ncbi:helix-turn-helix domain-containing protein [Thauera sp. Sel9]|nr:helix-turn-helix domain-containing protein [Thauera sp. Sel9]
MGVTPYRFLINKRMSIAAERLRSERFPIKVIAQDVGFSSSRHFAVSFKAWSGKSPTDYREERLR